jgi:hypothetical protein
VSGRSKGDITPRPYAPSWVDHFTTLVGRLPGSSWYFYLGLWLVLASVLVAALWIEGVYSMGTVFPAQLFIPAMITLLLAMFPFLDQRADAALTTLQPALKASEDELSQLRYQLTTLPGLPTFLASLAMVAVILLLDISAGDRESSIEALAASPIAANLLYLVYFVGWWVFGAFAYHTIRQLRVINRIYTSYTRVSLFAVSPLYGFSSVTALTAIVLVIATYGWTALNPENLSDPVAIAGMFLVSVLALAVFAWPLLGTRRLLAKEKAGLLDEVALRHRATYVKLHQRIDAGQLEELEDLTKVISILEAERDMLNSICTWPWQPETLRYLVTALGLPLLLWILQYILQLVLVS